MVLCADGCVPFWFDDCEKEPRDATHCAFHRSGIFKYIEEWLNYLLVLLEYFGENIIHLNFDQI